MWFARGNEEYANGTREDTELRTTANSNNESKHKDVRSAVREWEKKWAAAWTVND